MEDRMAALEADVQDALDAHGVSKGAYEIKRQEWAILVDARAEQAVGRALRKGLRHSGVSVRTVRREAPASNNFKVTHKTFNDRQKEILQAAQFLIDADDTPYENLWQVLDGEANHDQEAHLDIEMEIDRREGVDVFEMLKALTEPEA